MSPSSVPRAVFSYACAVGFHELTGRTSVSSGDRMIRGRMSLHEDGTLVGLAPGTPTPMYEHGTNVSPVDGFRADMGVPMFVNDYDF